MDTSNLFTVALNLGNPWSVSKVDFIPATDNPTQMELHIWVSYPEGSKFSCPTEVCGKCVRNMTMINEFGDTLTFTSIRLLSSLNFQELNVKIMVSVP